MYLQSVQLESVYLGPVSLKFMYLFVSMHIYSYSYIFIYICLYLFVFPHLFLFVFIERPPGIRFMSTVGHKLPNGGGMAGERIERPEGGRGQGMDKGWHGEGDGTRRARETF